MSAFKERIYYNQEIKQKFIDSLPQNRVALCERIFLNSYGMETSKGKDLSEFNRDEILEMYSYFNVKTPSILRDIHSIVKMYARDMGRNISFLDNISSDLLKSKVNRVALRVKLISREELLSALEKAEEDPVFNPSDAFVVLACFEGMENKNLEDIQRITIDDFHKKGKQYYADLASGRVIKVSDALYRYAKASASAYSRNALYKGTSVRHWALESDNPRSVIKYIRTNNNKSQTLGNVPKEQLLKQKKKTLYGYIQYQIKMSNLPKYLTTTKGLRMSGILDYIKRRCKELGITHEDFLMSNIKEIVDQYNFTNEYVARKAIRDYYDE